MAGVGWVSVDRSRARWGGAGRIFWEARLDLPAGYEDGAIAKEPGGSDQGWGVLAPFLFLAAGGRGCWRNRPTRGSVGVKRAAWREGVPCPGGRIGRMPFSGGKPSPGRGSRSEWAGPRFTGGGGRPRNSTPSRLPRSAPSVQPLRYPSSPLPARSPPATLFAGQAPVVDELLEGNPCYPGKLPLPHPVGRSPASFPRPAGGKPGPRFPRRVRSRPSLCGIPLLRASFASFHGTQASEEPLGPEFPRPYLQDWPRQTGRALQSPRSFLRSPLFMALSLPTPSRPPTQPSARTPPTSRS